ncbi:hypothetical protein BASA81_007868 [Batrachochytrium salamandrivorans]|nr:hypothetical protein BASA81_007868 [Batrachochytrium salamandrivorans]
MKELVLRYDGNRARSIEDHLVPALKHPNCNLAKLSLWASQEHVETAQESCERLFWDASRVETRSHGDGMQSGLELSGLGLLEHPSNRIKVLDISPNTKGDIARFFAALGQSQVSALALCYSSNFAQGLCEYLARDLLVRLKVRMGKRQVPAEMMMSLVDCTRLAKLELIECEFSQPTVFTLPKVHHPAKVIRLHVCWSF